MEEKEEKRHQDQRRFLIVGTCIFDSPSAFFSTSTNDMTASEQLDETLSLQPLPNFTHIITIPFPSPRVQTQLTVHLTLFNGPSILLWCGECAEGWTDSSEESSVEQATATSAPSSSLLIEENPPPRSLPSTQELPPVTGRLASEWAVAMSNTRTKVSRLCISFRSIFSVDSHFCSQAHKLDFFVSE
jgi:hypothetical protein